MSLFVACRNVAMKAGWNPANESYSLNEVQERSLLPV